MADPAKVRVLVVSEDEAILEDARFGFPSHVEVTTASDATDAGQTLDELRPALVIVDQRTGSAGGFALARYMSQMKMLKDVPVLILLERDHDVWLAKQAGAALVRTKPITAEALATDALSLLS